MAFRKDLQRPPAWQVPGARGPPDRIIIVIIIIINMITLIMRNIDIDIIIHSIITIRYYYSYCYYPGARGPPDPSHAPPHTMLYYTIL